MSLPKTIASNLIHYVCNCHPIDNRLALRFLKFMNMNFTSDNIKVRICGNLAMQGSGSAVSKTQYFLSQKFNVKCESDFYGKFKKSLRCPVVDHKNQNIISGLICDTLYLRDYDHPYFTYQECNDLLQFMCCQRVPKLTLHVLCLLFLYIYVALYKLYVLFSVCFFLYCCNSVP